MAAPTPTPRVDPVGRRLSKGYRMEVTFAADSNVSFWEIEITPFGFEADDFVDTTTQRNDEVRTYSPKTLYRTTDATVVAQYDPAVYPQIMALMNVATVITFWFPDGSSVCAYGALKSFIPDALSEKMTDPPQCTLTIGFTNTDPSACTEEVPVYTAGTGTAPTC